MNRGTILAGQSGIAINGVDTVVGGITNGGTISAMVGGIVLNTVGDFSGGIVNSGSIISEDNFGIGIETVTVFGSSSAGGGITNTGTLQGDISLIRVGTFFWQYRQWQRWQDHQRGH